MPHATWIRQEMDIGDNGLVSALAWRLYCSCGFMGPLRDRADLARRDEEQHHLEVTIDTAEFC